MARIRPTSLIHHLHLAGRGILYKARRPNVYDATTKDASDLNSRAIPSVIECEAATQPLSAEAAMLGEVERMPDDLDHPTVGNPFSKRTTTLSPGGKMRPSSYFQANEIKQIKRNRYVIPCLFVHGLEISVALKYS